MNLYTDYNLYRGEHCYALVLQAEVSLGGMDEPGVTIYNITHHGEPFKVTDEERFDMEDAVYREAESAVIDGAAP